MFKTVTKAQIFTAAWAYARQGAAQFGGKVRDYFAAALRTSYEMARQAEAINLAAIEAAKPAVVSTIDKLNFLGSRLYVDRAYAKGSFAHKFVSDNASRLVKYGHKIALSEKQIAVIDKLYADAH